MILYVRNSPYYGTPAPAFALEDGREFITGSAAQVWWSVPANNRNTFDISQGIYANNTPDCDVRQICETNNSAGHVAYIAMVDFRPAAPLFPLTLNGFRIGDFLQIDTHLLTNKPGGENLTFQVAYTLTPIDLPNTEVKSPLTGVNPAVPNGTEFSWNDIVYLLPTAPVTVNIPAGTGPQTVYDGVEGKIVSVDIIVTDHGTGSIPTQTITKHITAADLGGAGQSTLLTLTTDKLGWFDSQTNTFTENDITVHTTTVPFN